MKTELIIKIVIYNIILILILVVVLYNLFKIRRTLKLEQRISKYTIKAEKDHVVSFGDEIRSFLNGVLIKLEKRLKNINYYKYKSKKYEKYVHNLKGEKNSPYRILAFKIILSFIFGLLYILSSIFSFKFNILIFLLVIIVSYYFYDIYLIIYEKRRNKLIENDLLKAIIIMNNAFKSGYNITQAINMVTKDLKGPIKEEFTRIQDDLDYGLELKDVFDRFYNRVQLEDAKYITSSLNLLNLTGGNITWIFSSIEKSFTNRKRLRNELNALTSSSNLVYKVLLAMPFLLISLILIFNPTYFSPLFTSAIGYFLIGLEVGLLVLYIIVIKKIIKVDV